MPGGGGGGSFGSDLDSLGAPGAPEEGDITGNEGSEPTGEMGGNNEGGGSMPPPPTPPPTNESINMFDRYLNVMNERIERKKNSEKVLERAKIYDKSLLINEEFSKMIDSLNLLNNDEEADE